MDHTLGNITAFAILSTTADQVAINAIRGAGGPKEFWKKQYLSAYTGPTHILELAGWTLIMLIAAPAAIIRRLLTWMMPSLRS